MTTKQNPFPSPSPLQKVLLNELALVAERCYSRGWSWGTAGNFSVRGTGSLIWQSPTGLCKGDLKPELFVAVDLNSESAVEAYTQKPSAEMPVHAGIYKAVPEALCVVHTHPPETVAASNLSDQFVFTGEEMAKAMGLSTHEDTLVIPILANPNPAQMKTFSLLVHTGILAPAKVVILKGHGVYAWGKSPLEAMAYLEALEFLCQNLRLRR